MANVTITLSNDQCAGVKYHFGLADQSAALAKLAEWVVASAAAWNTDRLSGDALAIQNEILTALSLAPNKIEAVKAVLGIH